jgi:hypothetical protein
MIENLLPLLLPQQILAKTLVYFLRIDIFYFCGCSGIIQAEQSRGRCVTMMAALKLFQSQSPVE